MSSQRTDPVYPDDRDRGPSIGRAEVARLAHVIASELWLGLGGRYPLADLNVIVEKAIRDLSTSVAFESLPEMAARLAAARVTRSSEVLDCAHLFARVT